MTGSRIPRTLVALLGVAIIAAWWLTSPQTVSSSDLPGHQADPVAGERVFWAGGCASCHASPVDGKRAKGDDKLLLGGGLELDTPYGVFRVPNISSHPEDGIGGWTPADFINAMQRGVSPEGRHYYPSFPYTSYARMPVEDVMDLKAFIDTLPAVEGRIAPSMTAKTNIDHFFFDPSARPRPDEALSLRPRHPRSATRAPRRWGGPHAARRAG